MNAWESDGAARRTLISRGLHLGFIRYQHFLLLELSFVTGLTAMKNKLLDQASHWGNKASDALSSAASKAGAFVQEHKPDDQEIAQAKAWVKNAATATAEEATRMGKEVIQSEMARDAAKGAAVGAAIAVPVPLVGPVFGGLVGAGIGVYANLTRSRPAAPPVIPAAAPQPTTVIEMATPARDVPAELRKLHDLLKEGILTQEEFDAQKKKVLGSL